MKERQRNYRIELDNHHTQREKRENDLKEAEYKIEMEIFNEASKALNDEATFTAEMRDQRINYENEYRAYIQQQRKEEE